MVTTLQRKLAPPLVTLLGAEPELQYVVRTCCCWGICSVEACVIGRAALHALAAAAFGTWWYGIRLISLFHP